MSVLHRWVIPWTNTCTTSASEVAVPVGGWEPLNPAAIQGRGWGELRASFGSVSVGFGFQYTNDLNSTPSSTRVSSLQVSDGVSNPNTAPTSFDLYGSKYIRPCVFVASGDENIAGGAVAGIVELWG